MIDKHQTKRRGVLQSTTNDTLFLLFAAFFFGTLELGCVGDTGREVVSVQAFGRGQNGSTITIDGWQITLDRADIGLGPLTFCATASASTEFCEPALLEMRQGVTVDGLNAQAQSIGVLEGTTGTVRSGFLDYGISWLLTEPDPRANQGAPGVPLMPMQPDAALSVRPTTTNYTPQGHSLRLSGTASCVEGPGVCCAAFPTLNDCNAAIADGTRSCCYEATNCPTQFSFTANVDVVPQQPGTNAVHGLSTEHEVSIRTSELEVTFAPLAWARRMCFSRLAENAAEDPNGDSILLTPSDADYSNLVNAMTSGATPAFGWTDTTQ